MLLPPAPDAPLKLVQCGYKKGCETRACTCKAHGIASSELWHCKDCMNGEIEEEISDEEEGDSEEDDIEAISESDEQDNDRESSDKELDSIR